MNLNRRLVRSFLAAVLTATAMAGFAPTASALGGEQGVLLLKGPGSVYGQPGAISSLSVAAGSTATFGFEVRNTGSSVAQFNIQLLSDSGTCFWGCSAQEVMTAGSTDVTSLASGPNGYFTAPINPGSVATYTLKITPAKLNSSGPLTTGSVPGDLLDFPIRLSDTAGTQLGLTSSALVNITNGTGSGSGADQFVSASGTPVTSGNYVSGWGIATAPSVVVGKTFAFTVKLMNDGTTPTAITYQLGEVQACTAYFPLKIMQGSTLSGTNVTAAVLAGTYSTATLAHGASVTLNVTGTSLSGGAACLQAHHAGSAAWAGTTQDAASDTALNYLVFSPAG